MKQLTACLSVLFILASCEQVKEKSERKDATSNKSKTVQNKKVTLDSDDDTIPKITIPDGTIQASYKIADTISKIRILNTIDYNKQDINPKIAKLNWIGLFYKNDDNFYVTPTKFNLFQNIQKWMKKLAKKQDGA
jgi:hypothetical protein